MLSKKHEKFGILCHKRITETQNKKFSSQSCKVYSFDQLARINDRNGIRERVRVESMSHSTHFGDTLKLTCVNKHIDALQN